MLTKKAKSIVQQATQLLAIAVLVLLLPFSAAAQKTDVKTPPKQMSFGTFVKYGDDAKAQPKNPNLAETIGNFIEDIRTARLYRELITFEENDTIQSPAVVLPS